MKVRFSTVATRGFLFLPTRRFDLALRVANFQMKKDNINESLWDQGIEDFAILGEFCAKIITLRL